jgi:hypothetical protein
LGVDQQQRQLQNQTPETEIYFTQAAAEGMMLETGSKIVQKSKETG